MSCLRRYSEDPAIFAWCGPIIPFLLSCVSKAPSSSLCWAGRTCWGPHVLPDGCAVALAAASFAEGNACAGTS